MLCVLEHREPGVFKNLIDFLGLLHLLASTCSDPYSVYPWFESRWAHVDEQTMHPLRRCCSRQSQHHVKPGSVRRLAESVRKIGVETEHVIRLWIPVVNTTN